MSKERAAQLIDAGVWLKLSGDIEGATKLFERALKLDPDNERARQLLGESPTALSPVFVPSGASANPFAAPEPGAAAPPPGYASAMPSDWGSTLPAPISAPSGVRALTPVPAPLPHDTQSGGPPDVTAPMNPPDQSFRTEDTLPGGHPLNDDWGSLTGDDRDRTQPDTIAPKISPLVPRFTPPMGKPSSATVTLSGEPMARKGVPLTPPLFDAGAVATLANGDASPAPELEAPEPLNAFAGEASRSEFSVDIDLDEPTAAVPAPGGGDEPSETDVDIEFDVPAPSASPSAQEVPIALQPNYQAWQWTGDMRNTPMPNSKPAFVPLETTPAPRFTPELHGGSTASAWDQKSNPAIQLKQGSGQGAGLELIRPVSSASVVASGATQNEVKTMLKSARDMLELDDHTGAMELILKAQALAPDDPEVMGMREKSEKTLLAMFESKLGKLEAVPRVLLKDDEIIWLNLDHRAGFVLAQIDGTVSFDDVFAVSGMSRLDTARILAQLIDEGVISRA